MFTPLLGSVLLGSTSSASGASPTPLIPPQFTFNVGDGNTHDSRMISISDVDGDGLRDLLIGIGDLDLVELYSGATGALLGALTPPAGAAGFGRGLSAADLDGDGVDELFVGAPQTGVNGAVSVYQWPAPAALYSIAPVTPSASNMAFGESLRAYDESGSGTIGLLVGAPDWEASPNVISGLVEAWVPTLGGAFFFQAFATGVTNGRFGSNIDAFDNAPASSFSLVSEPGNGQVYVHTGWFTTGAPVELNNVTGMGPNPGGFGQDIAALGSGRYLVGAPFTSTSGFGSFEGAGLAYAVKPGRSSRLLYTFPGARVTEQRGNYVASAQDWNNDGFLDFLVGDDYSPTTPRIYSGRDGALLNILYFPGTSSEGTALEPATGGAGSTLAIMNKLGLVAVY